MPSEKNSRSAHYANNEFRGLGKLKCHVCLQPLRDHPVSSGICQKPKVYGPDNTKKRRKTVETNLG